MATDDAARKSRADQLRKQIKQLQTPPPAADEPKSPDPLPGESPHHYVERRMREIDRDKAAEEK